MNKTCSNKNTLKSRSKFRSQKGGRPRLGRRKTPIKFVEFSQQQIDRMQTRPRIYIRKLYESMTV